MGKNDDEMGPFERGIFERADRDALGLADMFYSGARASGLAGDSGDADLAEQVAELREAVARVERKIDLIFGDAVVIGGRFVHTGKGAP
jgi:hypothetical protein